MMMFSLNLVFAASENLMTSESNHSSLWNTLAGFVKLLSADLCW